MKRDKVWEKPLEFLQSGLLEIYPWEIAVEALCSPCFKQSFRSTIASSGSNLNDFSRSCLWTLWQHVTMGRSRKWKLMGTSSWQCLQLNTRSHFSQCAQSHCSHLHHRLQLEIPLHLIHKSIEASLQNVTLNFCSYKWKRLQTQTHGRKWKWKCIYNLKILIVNK